MIAEQPAALCYRVTHLQLGRVHCDDNLHNERKRSALFRIR